MAKFIFVTGGVVSSLGKGVAAASIGMLLKRRGFKVDILKYDPYLNTNPGLLSTAQHGEVYITDDGTEADLDLGHYERFMDINVDKHSTVTNGRVFWTILTKEKEGQYHGDTIQFVPHFTEEVKDVFRRKERMGDADIIIVEIGGTVGDLESMPVLEAVRQFKCERPRDILSIHLALVPYLSTAEELKTKPLQHSVKELCSLGIQPDIILCRSPRKLYRDEIEKISLRCNVAPECVKSSIDTDCIYKIPLNYYEEGVDELIIEKLNLVPPSDIDLEDWKRFVRRLNNPCFTIDVAIVGRYAEMADSYKSLLEALNHAAESLYGRVRFVGINTIQSLKDAETILGGVGGIIIPNDAEEDDHETGLLAIQYAREKNIPVLAIGHGMRLMVNEFIANVLKQDLAKLFNSQYRLGKFATVIEDYDSILFEAYKNSVISERHRHREVLSYDRAGFLHASGLKITARSMQGTVDAVELDGHKWFVGVQFDPQFKSRPNKPNPLLVSFLKAIIN